MAEHDIAESRPYVTPSGDLQSLMSREEAELALAVLHHDNDWRGLLNLAAAEFVIGREADALGTIRHAVALARNPTTLLNLSIILDAFGRYDESLAAAAEGHSLDPLDHTLGCQLADSLIRASRWEEGWHLFTRYHAHRSNLRPFIAEWDGIASLDGKRILVLEWGGIGDNIFFLRWLIDLFKRGAVITLACPNALAPLLASLPYVKTLLPTRGGTLDSLSPKDYDYFVSLHALPGLLRKRATDADLWRGPYLPTAPGRSPLRRTDRLLIGVCWRAGEGGWPRRMKSLSPIQLDRLLATHFPAPVRWVNLQFDMYLPLPALSPALTDWLDTAKVIADCDLVVTVDTGVAHLAGAIGVPTFVILPGKSAWSYLLDAPTTPLYPSMRLFRNPGLGIDIALDAVINTLEAPDA